MPAWPGTERVWGGSGQLRPARAGSRGVLRGARAPPEKRFAVRKRVPGAGPTRGAGQPLGRDLGPGVDRPPAGAPGAAAASAGGGGKAGRRPAPCAGARGVAGLRVVWVPALPAG